MCIVKLSNERNVSWVEYSLYPSLVQRERQRKGRYEYKEREKNGVS
jgi:hypothetical protein